MTWTVPNPPIIYEHRPDGWWFSEDFGRHWQKGVK